jgi:hypothetical protein
MSRIFLRYNDKDRIALERGKKLYDGIVFDANQIALKPNTATLFLSKVDKDFFIDPSTYFFQPESGSAEKLSVIKLAESYGLSEPEEPVLSSSDFTDSKFRKIFLENVFSFQMRKLRGRQQLLSRYIMSKSSDPKFLIPPYFTIESPDSNWLQVNVQLAKEFAKILGSRISKILPTIAISDPDYLISIDKEKLIKFVRSLPGKMINVWIADFDKKKVTEEYLGGYKFFIDTINEEKNILCSYASFFDLLLRVDSVSHSVIGGDVKYLGGGGVPPLRVYIPFLRREFSLSYVLPIITNYANTFGYSYGTNLIRESKRLQQIEIELAPLKQKAQFTDARSNSTRMRYSLLTPKERSKFKELSDEKKQIITEFKVQFLIERSKEMEWIKKSKLEIVIEDMKNVKDTVEQKEALIRLAKLYAGHLGRWITATQK